MVAIRDIKKGESFTKENIWVKRPGTGEIPAEDYPNVLGKKATCDIASDTQIKKSMVESLWEKFCLLPEQEQTMEKLNH